MSVRFAIVCALENGTNGIGKKSAGMSWTLKQDLKSFQNITTTTLTKPEIDSQTNIFKSTEKNEKNEKPEPNKNQNAVIMGRKTWESLPEKIRPLKNRINIVLSSRCDKKTEAPNHHVMPSLDDALKFLSKSQHSGQVFVIGGGEIYQEAINRAECTDLYLTRVFTNSSNCDVFFPSSYAQSFVLQTAGARVKDMDLSTSKELEFQVEHWVKRNEEEEAYLNMIRDVLKNGEIRKDRTGVGSKASFGHLLRFSLKDGQFPLLTTKRVFWRGVVEELLWMLRGSTDAKELAAKKVHIWDANGSRQFLDKLGFVKRAEGQLGPVYGFQWRHFGAKYEEGKQDYSNEGVDQIAQVIAQLKNNPKEKENRRIRFTAWNPTDLPLMALPPCHVSADFDVSPDGFLSCMLFQRSCDTVLGAPFNIASYALLTYMLAYICNLKPGNLVYATANTHVYLNHITKNLETQLERIPRRFPTLTINVNDKKKTITDPKDFRFEDFIVEGYDPYPSLAFDMAI